MRQEAEQKRADRVLEERNSAFRILYDTVIEITSAADDQVFVILCRNLRRIANAACAALASYDAALRTLTLEAVAFERRDSNLFPVERPGGTVSLPEDVLDSLMQGHIGLCRDRAAGFPVLFPEVSRADDGCADTAECYTLSCVRGGELVAAGLIRLHPNQKLKMKDMIDTYLSLAGIIIQRVESVSALRTSEEKLAGILRSVTDPVSYTHLTLPTN